MSGTTIDLDPGKTEEPKTAIILEEGDIGDQGTGQSDQDAIRQAQEALRARTEAETRASAATNENANLRNQLARERAGRHTDRRAVLGQSVQGADSEIRSALAAKRAARESGDLDAEDKADEALQSARFRKHQAESELVGLPKDAPEPTSENMRPADNQPRAPSQRLQQWLADHPRFNSDQQYKQSALDLHNLLAGQGVTETGNPDEYYRRINHGLSMVYGQDHGQTPGNGDTPMAGSRGSGIGTGGNTSTAGVPSRGSGNSGAVRTVELMSNLGSLIVQSRQGSKPVIRFADERTRENMLEGASACWPAQYAKDPSATLTRYVEAQLQIAREREAGGNGGVQVTEGVTLR